MDGKKVMIAIDDGDCSLFAVEWAISNFKPLILSGAQILLFTAISRDVAAGTLGLVATIQEKQEEFAIALLERAKNLCAKYGVDAETVYEFGNPQEEICDAVDKYKVQLLVLGTHGKGTIQRAFLGSVSNYCVNNAKCPVMVVRYPPS